MAILTLGDAGNPVLGTECRSFGQFSADMTAVAQPERKYWEAGPGQIHVGFTEAKIAKVLARGNRLVPEVALEFPDALRALHVDFQRAGSDVVEAFTYNGHREKMRVIGKEDLLEPLGPSGHDDEVVPTCGELFAEFPADPGAGSRDECCCHGFTLTCERRAQRVNSGHPEP